MNSIVEEKVNVIKGLCNQYKVKSLYVFGSVTTPNFAASSDIDFLISFDKTISIEEYTENYFLLHAQLKSLFNRNIDLLTDSSLSNPYFIASLEQSKQLVYAA